MAYSHLLRAWWYALFFFALTLAAIGCQGPFDNQDFGTANDPILDDPVPNTSCATVGCTYSNYFCDDDNYDPPECWPRSVPCFDANGDPINCGSIECHYLIGCNGGREICTDLVDNNGDGDVDCDDAQCVGTAACTNADPFELCTNGYNDDPGQDLDVDCDDSECATHPACVGAEICNDGVDNDGVNGIDCADIPACGGHYLCGGVETGLCTDMVDNDSDGLLNCVDPDCFTDSACIQENCTNGADDDNDGDVDCADDECSGQMVCQPEICNNGNDDNDDGLVDCQDVPACGTHPFCAGEICNNGIDDNSNGDTDCADLACSSFPACITEVCNNGIDDNSNGDIDCADGQCASFPACILEDCTNNIDDNSNGQIDCADPQCFNDPVCVPEDCTNGVDDNSNGDVDCADLQCSTQPVCNQEICANGIDDSDADSDIDADDSECLTQTVAGMQLNFGPQLQDPALSYVLTVAQDGEYLARLIPQNSQWGVEIDGANRRAGIWIETSNVVITSGQTFTCWSDVPPYGFNVPLASVSVSGTTFGFTATDDGDPLTEEAIWIYCQLAGAPEVTTSLYDTQLPVVTP